MATVNASLDIKQIIVTDDTGTQILVLYFAIDCDVCGQTEGVIFGHHLRTLHKAIGMMIESHPELCGPEGTVTERTEFHGVSDPTKARLN